MVDDKVLAIVKEQYYVAKKPENAHPHWSHYTGQLSVVVDVGTKV